MSTTAARLLREMTEAEFQQSIIDLARLRGWLYYHTNNSQRSTPGFPDLILVRGPVMLAVEVKTDAGKTTDQQEAWLDALGQIPGCTSFVTRPTTWDALVEKLA